MVTDLGRMTVRERRLWLMPVVALLALAMMTAGPALYVANGATIGTLAVSASLLAAYLLALEALSRWRRATTAPLYADRVGLRLGERLVATRASVGNAYLAPHGTSLRLHLTRGFRPYVEVDVADDAQARAILGALELDAARAVARYHFRRGRASARQEWAIVFAMLAFMVVYMGAVMWVDITGPAPVFVPPLLFCAALTTRAARISVGADALRIHIPFWPTRTLPYAGVAAVSHAGANIAIELKNGETLRFGNVGHSRQLRVEFAANAADFAARVGSRLRAQTSRVDDTSDVLRRAGRATDAWLRDLAALRQAGSYRAAAMPDDVLWRIAEDPFAPPDARGGAAFALKASLDESGRARIRVAADACAAPELRAALEAIASDADAARALDRLGT